MNNTTYKKKMRYSSSLRSMINKLKDQYKLDSGNDCVKLLLNRYMHEVFDEEHIQLLISTFVCEVRNYNEQFSSSTLLKRLLTNLQELNLSFDAFVDKYNLNALDDDLTMRLTDDQMSFIEEMCSLREINFTKQVNDMLITELSILEWNASIYDLVNDLLSSIKGDATSEQNSFGQKRSKTRFYNQILLPAYNVLTDELKKHKNLK
jgi:hypothetical protein